jgi:hypothetical protein
MCLEILKTHARELSFNVGMQRSRPRTSLNPEANGFFEVSFIQQNADNEYTLQGMRPARDAR